MKDVQQFKKEVKGKSEKIQAWTGFEPMSSAMQVQLSYLGVNEELVSL